MPKKLKQNLADLPLVADEVEAYSIAETARLFGLSTQQVRRLVNEGRLDGVGHRPTPTGLGYFVPRASMEARGYVLKAPTSSEEAEALKAEKEALEARLKALQAELEAAQTAAKASAEATGRAEEAASSAKVELDQAKIMLLATKALADAKARESYLLEQALLRLPLVLDDNRSWWQRMLGKKPTEAEKRAALEVLKAEKPAE
jgi:hypothetical protein